MAAPVKKLGADGAVKTGVTTEIADKTGKTVTAEGPISDVESLCEDPSSIVPEGFEPVRGVAAPTGGGMGRLTLSCVKYDAATVENAQPIRETVGIDMEEVTYDLVDHPSLAACRDVCRKWLATDEAKRVVVVGQNTEYYYADETGREVKVENATALKFCNAYMAGIKSFVRYFPVVVKLSIYKNPPGLTRSGRSFTGGSPKFSDNCGTFDEPPVTLSGYPSTNWFKGGDRWQERGDTTWELTEKWTYTPDGSDGPHAWIYEAPESQNANQNGGGA